MSASAAPRSMTMSQIIGELVELARTELSHKDNKKEQPAPVVASADDGARLVVPLKSIICKADETIYSSRRFHYRLTVERSGERHKHRSVDIIPIDPAKGYADWVDAEWKRTTDLCFLGVFECTTFRDLPIFKQPNEPAVIRSDIVVSIEKRCTTYAFSARALGPLTQYDCHDRRWDSAVFDIRLSILPDNVVFGYISRAGVSGADYYDDAPELCDIFAREALVDKRHLKFIPRISAANLTFDSDGRVHEQEIY